MIIVGEKGHGNGVYECSFDYRYYKDIWVVKNLCKTLDDGSACATAEKNGDCVSSENYATVFKGIDFIASSIICFSWFTKTPIFEILFPILLEIILALDSEKHFNRAAEKLKISQPALSMKLKALELSLIHI